MFSRLGAGPGRPVATVLPNGAEPFEVATAAAMFDAPYLPINWHLKAGELAYIFADAGVAVVVGHARFEADLTAALASPGLSCSRWWWAATTNRPSTRRTRSPRVTAVRVRS